MSAFGIFLYEIDVAAKGRFPPFLQKVFSIETETVRPQLTAAKSRIAVIGAKRSEGPVSALGADQHERPIAAVRLVAERCGAASPQRPFVRRAAFLGGEGWQSGTELPSAHAANAHAIFARDRDTERFAMRRNSPSQRLLHVTTSPFKLTLRCAMFAQEGREGSCRTVAKAPRLV